MPSCIYRARELRVVGSQTWLSLRAWLSLWIWVRHSCPYQQSGLPAASGGSSCTVLNRPGKYEGGEDTTKMHEEKLKATVIRILDRIVLQRNNRQLREQYEFKWLLWVKKLTVFGTKRRNSYKRCAMTSSAHLLTTKITVSIKTWMPLKIKKFESKNINQQKNKVEGSYSQTAEHEVTLCCMCKAFRGWPATEPSEKINGNTS